MLFRSVILFFGGEERELLKGCGGKVLAMMFCGRGSLLCSPPRLDLGATTVILRLYVRLMERL